MWLISVPAWGVRCVELAVSVTIPSILAALRYAQVEGQFVIHTDRPLAFREVLAARQVRYRAMESDEKLRGLGVAHAEALAWAVPGQYVGLFCADHVVSREAFKVAELAFIAGKRLVVCGGMRTRGIAVPAPGASAEAVQAFAVGNPHPISVACSWPVLSVLPSVIYFREGDNCVLHGFHLHPFALVARPGLTFSKTIDRDLMDCFGEAQTEVVTDNAMALAEISPASKVHGTRTEPHTAYTIAEWARRNTSLRHRWFFRHRIAMTGDAAALDCSPVKEILSRI